MEVLHALGGVTGGNGAFEGPFELPTTNLVQGANRIAVLLKQTGAASSDITMAIALSALAQLPVGPSPTISIAPGAVSWTDATAVLEYATALDNNPLLTVWDDVSNLCACIVASPFDPGTLPASATGSYFFRLRQ